MPLVEGSEVSEADIRQELASILDSGPFRNSERYRRFLKYVVERTLDGHSADLKERSIGLDVFRRNPDYDTAADPVVRITAGEVRKRIAQYYEAAGPHHEVRIALQPGSYVPQFRRMAGGEAVEAKPEEGTGGAPHRFGWMAGIAVLALVAAAAFVAGLDWRKPPAVETAVARFWKPLSGSTSLLMSVGELDSEYGADPGSEQTETEERATSPVATLTSESSSTVKDLLSRNTVSWADAIATSKLSGFVQAGGETFRVRRSRSTSLADMRESPAILVGGFNNKWIMGLLAHLRFQYRYDASAEKVHWIEDRTNPGKRDWSVRLMESPADFHRDYGIVARFFEPTTERPVVVVSGIAAYGTVSAAEFLTTPKYLAELDKKLPPGWEKKNLEVVFTTQVFEGNIGPPKILVVHVW